MIQLNGGTIPEKVDLARGLMEKTLPVKDVFSQDKMVHIGVTKGHGVKGGWPRDGFVLFWSLFVMNQLFHSVLEEKSYSAALAEVA